VESAITNTWPIFRLGVVLGVVVGVVEGDGGGEALGLAPELPVEDDDAPLLPPPAGTGPGAGTADGPGDPFPPAAPLGWIAVGGSLSAASAADCAAERPSAPVTISTLASADSPATAPS
jgi:hypothetical protein